MMMLRMIFIVLTLAFDGGIVGVAASELVARLALHAWRWIAVYRIDPATATCTIVADDFDRPNGLAFSPDETTLYIADSRLSHIRVFDVGDGDRLSGGRMFADGGDDSFDGIRFDHAGRLWTASGQGVRCYDPDGTLIGRLRLPEVASNLVFGGPKRNRLFITATTSVYSIMLTVNGARPVWAA